MATMQLTEMIVIVQIIQYQSEQTGGTYENGFGKPRSLFSHNDRSYSGLDGASYRVLKQLNL